MQDAVMIRPPSLQAARVAHLRLAHNALAVALLKSRNVPLPSGVPSNVPHTASVKTPGGREVQVLEGIEKRIDSAAANLSYTQPGTPNHGYWSAQLDRLEAHRDQLKATLKGLTAGPPVRPGYSDIYTVHVPPLTADIAGVSHTAPAHILTLAADPATPNYERYLGRGTHPGHRGRGPYPLWRPYSGGVKAATEAEDWHFVLIAQLWGAQTLPDLTPRNADDADPGAERADIA